MRGWTREERRGKSHERSEQRELGIGKREASSAETYNGEREREHAIEARRENGNTIE